MRPARLESIEDVIHSVLKNGFVEETGMPISRLRSYTPPSVEMIALGRRNAELLRIAFLAFPASQGDGPFQEY